MGLSRLLRVVLLIAAVRQSVTDTTSHTSVAEGRAKSSKTEVIQIFNASDFSTDPSVLRRNLTFTVLLTSKVSENGNDCIMPKVMPALELAIRDVQRLGFPGVNFDVTLISRDSFCSSIYGAIGFFEIYSRWHDINAVFGLSCDYILAPISRYTGVWEIPVLSTSGRSPSFDVKEGQYPTLTRLMGGSTPLGHDIRRMLEGFNWTRAALIYQNTDRTVGNSVCFHFISALHNVLKEISIYQVGFDEKAFTRANITSKLKQIALVSRIVIMCADPKSIRQILLTADELNMIDSGEYVFINIELFSRDPLLLSEPWFDRNDTLENNDRARKAYTALLIVTPKQPHNEEYIRVSNEIKSIAATKYNYTFHENEPLSTFVTSFYDGVLLYANALNDSIREDPSVLARPINGTDMVRRMWNRSFTGITGNVTIDSNGDRISTYSVLDLNEVTGKFEIVANFMYNRLEFVQGKRIHWAANREHPPPDKPECGYDGSLCPDNSLPGYAILSTVLAFLLVLMAILFVLRYRHYKSEAEINSMTWKVSIDDVVWHESGGRSLRGSFHSLVKHNSQMTLISEDINSLCGDRQIFIPFGTYKGCRVAIKNINHTNVSLNRPLMLELKRMKDLQHDHLVKFYGACLDPKKSFLLTEYCPKGSLRDILEDDQQYQLDSMFKMSLMHDIIRGMLFIHNSDIKSHGNLKSSNCVVDSRFVLKITDFGLHSLRQKPAECDEENCNSHAYWSNLLWTAPELLRLENRPPEGTQKGDVYSFGIIVHEITTRQGPFYLGKTADISPQEIIRKVSSIPGFHSTPFRPHVSDSKTDDMSNLMVKCWAEEPCERPDFNTLKSTIRKINKDNETGNIVDNLLKRMEQYANNLEELVEERTKDYLEEKKKCEKLLYQLLPESVAAQLIRGQPVVAETFDRVTIYFSDIVGFTAISAESTPMQVVKFLNDLYTCFDSIVENFDVYKVETIGDAYMVVSGLPIRNGNQHAREIARLALALLDAVHNFTIHHRPNDRLKLRIGLHTGACVAGVVGLKMPRYCLFGDTVNTASRMESNGEALKIHISHATKTCLDEFGTFITRERGYVNMKGKGDMLTHWLEGENPSFDLTPKKRLQSSISNVHPSYTPSPVSSLRRQRKISSSSPKLNGCGITDSMKTDEQNSLIDITHSDGAVVDIGDSNRVLTSQQNGNSNDVALYEMPYQMAFKPKNNNDTQNSPKKELFNTSSNHSPHSNYGMARRNSTKTASDIARAAEISKRYNHHNNSKSNLNQIKSSNSNNSLIFNNIVKANNVKNLKSLCNSNELDSVKSGGTGVTQPLLTKINS